MCHYRSAWNNSHDAAWEMFEKNVQSGDYDVVKEIHGKHVSPKDGIIARLRMNEKDRRHWTGMTPTHYTDDSKSFPVLDFVLGKAILRCMEKDQKEFGSSEELTIVSKSDIIDYAVYGLGMVPQGIEPQEAPPGGGSKGSSQKPSRSQKPREISRRSNKRKTPYELLNGMTRRGKQYVTLGNQLRKLSKKSKKDRKKGSSNVVLTNSFKDYQQERIRSLGGIAEKS